MEPNKKYHKFDVFDVCERCGVEKRKVSVVGSGFNPNLSNKFNIEYSADGNNWQKEFINCKKTNK